MCSQALAQQHNDDLMAFSLIGVYDNNDKLNDDNKIANVHNNNI